MNKVYIVFEDNGELFEDYVKWIIRVFLDKNLAQKFVKKSKSREKRRAIKLHYYYEHDFWIEEYDIYEVVEE